ncbi:hypothetical protein [Tenacibaculum larymnensis]|uniref:SprB repeat-containing protein n=1 Tax=Tenacibaculum larymnensis TaxID=2878201 RepID=A0A9X4EVU2_9FLAO|nr:hypothetical protein [Tenacibaculum larymnensis]MDE1207637.1 hypothetical protein [Tenacibaculum larymnensis]
MKKKLLLILLLYSCLGFGQGYVFHEVIESLSLTCGNGDIADGAIPCKNSISISIVDGEIQGILKSEKGNKIDCSDSNNFELIELNPEQLFCGYTFIEGLDLSNYCYNHEVTYISIIPDNDFKILTPDPGVNNTTTSITLEASSGYHELVYNWMYYDPITNGWKKFPQEYLGKSSITFTAKDLFGSEAHLYTSKSIQYKLELCNGWSPKEPYTYVFISESPQLQDPIVTQKTSCNYKADGSLTFDFKRDLYTTEKLAVIIYQQNTESGKYDVILDQKLDIESLEKINETTYRYQWANNLPHGTYKLKYQTGKKGVGINPEDISWSNLVPVEFTIEETAKVDFQVTGSADQNCFTVNDGYIDISATGESSRTFLYQLKKDDVIQVFNGTNWVNYKGNNADNETWFPFTNAKTTRISNLNKAAYNVKVKDSEECLAKQL